MLVGIRQRRILEIFLAYNISSSAVRPYSSGTSSSWMSKDEKILWRRMCNTMSVTIPMIVKRGKKAEDVFSSQTIRTRIAVRKKLSPVLNAHAILDEYARYLTCFALVTFFSLKDIISVTCFSNYEYLNLLIRIIF